MSEAPRAALGIGAVVDSERPARWVHRALRRIEQLDGVQLRFLVVDNDPGPGRAPSAVTRFLLAVYEQADARAYPLGTNSLDPVALGDDVRRLIIDERSLPQADWFVDLRFDADSRPYLPVSRNGVLRPRNELVASGDRSSLDAIRRRSPVASQVELIDASGARVVAETIGACHPLSLRHTLDAACRRSEVLLERALRSLAAPY